MSISNPALFAIRFVYEEVYRNYTNKLERVDRVEQCMDMVANNMTDLIANWASLKTRFPHVKFFAITDASTQAILSAYHEITITSGTSVLSSFRAWSPYAIVSYLMLVLMVFVLFKIHSRVYRRYKASKAEIIHGKLWLKRTTTRKPVSFVQFCLCLVMNRPCSCPSIAGVSRKSLSFKLAHIMMLLLVSAMCFYCVAFIKTDLVTVREAVIVDSYEKILADPKLKVKWMSQEAEYEVFENSDLKSVKHRLWQKSQPDQMVTIMQSDSMTKLLKKLHESEIVMIGNSVTMSICGQVMCPLARSIDPNRPLITRHARDDEHEEVRSNMYNDRVDERIAKHLAFRMRQFSESGIMQYLHSLTGPPYDLGKEEDIRICRQNLPPLHQQPQVSQRVFQDYESLLKLILLLFIVALVTLSRRLLDCFQNLYQM
jgi:hypothetical protein